MLNSPQNNNKSTPPKDLKFQKSILGRYPIEMHTGPYDLLHHQQSVLYVSSEYKFMLAVLSYIVLCKKHNLSTCIAYNSGPLVVISSGINNKKLANFPTGPSQNFLNPNNHISSQTSAKLHMTFINNRVILLTAHTQCPASKKYRYTLTAFM